MIFKVFTVYDSKAECYMPPFCRVSKGIAIRDFQESAMSADHPFFKYPSDYTLFEIGEFDDATASYNLHSALVSLGTALEYKSRAESKS